MKTTYLLVALAWLCLFVTIAYQKNNSLRFTAFQSIKKRLFILSLIAISCICSPVKAQTEQYPTDSIMFPVNNGLDDYPGQVKFSGSRMRGPHVYYTYKDHDYNKTYIVGWYIMTLDHNGLTNGLPTSRIYNDLFFTKIQRLEEAVSDHTKKIYIPTHTVGLYIIDRETGESSKYNPLIG